MLVATSLGRKRRKKLKIGLAKKIFCVKILSRCKLDIGNLFSDSLVSDG
jgi:hypothetical protein